MSLGQARHLGRDIWFRYPDPSCLTQGVALDRNSFLGDTENDVWPKLNWLPPSVVLGKCSFILPPKNRIHVSVFKSSESQSLYHDLCLDSVENRILGFRLQFTVSRSLISRYLAWSCLGLQVLLESDPLSWCLLRFRRERHFGFLFSVYAFLFYDFPLSGLIVSGSSSPLRVRASIMIFA